MGGLFGYFVVNKCEFILFIYVFQDLFAVSVPKKANPRKRWGTGLSDAWDDWDDLDFGIPDKKNTKKLPMLGRRNIKEKDDFDDDDLFQ